MSTTTARKSAKTLRAVLNHISARNYSTRQLTEMLQEYAMPKAWADKLRELMEADQANEQSRNQAQTNDFQANIAQLSAKLQRLLDSYLDQDIDREMYTRQKGGNYEPKEKF
jgi:hypothetical protein